VIVKRTLVVSLLALVIAPAALARPAAVRETRVQSLNAGILVQLNLIRSRHGLVPLKLNAQLTAAANGHSAEMLADGYFQHNSRNGSPFWKRLTTYTNAARTGYWSVGENLLWSSPDVNPVKAMQLWMASPEHRKNILTARWREIGISSIHADSAGGTFGNQAVTVITTDFGVRR
jgi:uncharacterized protein YkwD